MMMGRKNVRHYIITGLILVGVAVYCLGPLYWIITTSLRVPGTEFRLPLEWWPSTPSVESYRIVTGEGIEIQEAILSSVFVSTTAMVGTILLSSLSAYAIARLRFRLKRLPFFIIQAAGLIPPIIIIAPTFVLMRSFGLLGSLWGLVIPNMAYGIPLATLLIASYFSSIPYDTEDAARIDGASEMTIFFRIMFPMALPAVFSAGVLSFLGSWGEFITALTVGLGTARTVPVAVLSLNQSFELEWTWVSAGTVLSLLPVIVAVILFQRLIIDGLTQGSSR